MEVRPNPTVNNSQQQHHRHAPATPSKQPLATPTTVDTTSVSQRLQKELMSLMMSGEDLGVSAFPDGESIFSWIGTIVGGRGTMYEGLSYKISLRFPLDYPFKPPQVKFETTCFHPNVDQFGNICLDILQDKWSSAYDCRTILLSIQSLLGEPNPDSPLNSYAAKLLNNKEERWSTNSIMREKYLITDIPRFASEMIPGCYTAAQSVLSRNVPVRRRGCKSIAVAMLCYVSYVHSHRIHLNPIGFIRKPSQRENGTDSIRGAVEADDERNRKLVTREADDADDKRSRGR